MKKFTQQNRVFWRKDIREAAVGWITVGRGRNIGESNDEEPGEWSINFV